MEKERFYVEPPKNCIVVSAILHVHSLIQSILGFANDSHHFLVCTLFINFQTMVSNLPCLTDSKRVSAKSPTRCHTDVVEKTLFSIVNPRSV